MRSTLPALASGVVRQLAFGAFVAIAANRVILVRATTATAIIVAIISNENKRSKIENARTGVSKTPINSGSRNTK